LSSAAERAFFAEHGWLILRGVVPPERLPALEQAVDALFAAWPPASADQVWELPGASRISPPLAAHARDPAVAAGAAAALGCARVQLLQDTLLVKSPGPACVAWHQDHTYTGYLRPSQLASARLALTPCTVESGCLEVIDRSHAWGPLGDVRALTESRVDDVLGARAAASADQVVALELQPGDLSLHHCLTLHRSGPNRTAAARKTLITRLFDSACTLVRELLPPGAEAHFPTAPDGRLSETAFPLL